MLSIIELASVTDCVDVKFANCCYEDMPHYVLSLHVSGDGEGEPANLKGNFRTPPSSINSSFDVHITYVCDACNFFLLYLSTLFIFYVHYVLLTCMR